jgi:hypothetical protein
MMAMSPEPMSAQKRSWAIFFKSRDSNATWQTNFAVSFSLLWLLSS